MPAFTGLGAPYWDPAARGAIFGLTRDTGIAEIVRSALEAVCYQTRDLMAAMGADGGTKLRALRVDGGMARNDWVMQFLADILDLPVERPVVTETTALGAAYLAGLQAGLFKSTADIAKRWQRDRLFEPRMQADQREALYAGWQAAVARVRSNGPRESERWTPCPAENAGQVGRKKIHHRDTEDTEKGDCPLRGRGVFGLLFERWTPCQAGSDCRRG